MIINNMARPFFLFVISLIAESVYIFPWSQQSLHLATFRFDNKEIVQAIDVRMIKKYHNQDKYERPSGKFKFTNMSDASNICGQKKDNKIIPCIKQSFYITFREINFFKKNESFFQTDDNLCLTIGKKN